MRFHKQQTEEELLEYGEYRKGEVIFLVTHSKPAAITRIYMKQCCGDPCPTPRFNLLIREQGKSRVINQVREHNIKKIATDAEQSEAWKVIQNG
jgi:hypothetical protein